MDNKYRVPALEKADAVLRTIAEQPHKLRLTDLSAQLGIHKSSMFSLLQTMESLEWVVKDDADTYAVSSAMGRYGRAFFRSTDVIGAFHKEAPATANRIGETIQLARLEGREVLYLGKEEVPSPIRLASDPGMKFPAHATALGKALLAGLPEDKLMALYPDERLESLTPYGIASRDELFRQVSEARRCGYAYDRQEAVIGFYCVAAPIFNERGDTVAAVSCSMPAHVWELKQELAQQEVYGLAKRIANNY